MASWVGCCRRRFQSTPPRGGRRLVPGGQGVDDAVSIHAPARGATSRQRQAGEMGEFQSTPPRGGRRAGAGRRGRDPVVSIHAPARGATGTAPTATCITPCFNPRPRAGGDRSPRCWARPPGPRFNPRPRAGGDVREGDVEAGRTAVSIHAPARGATGASQTGAELDTFQSTPPRGGRLSTTVQSTPATVFQSTPPRGGRLWALWGLACAGSRAGEREPSPFSFCYSVVTEHQNPTSCINSTSCRANLSGLGRMLQVRAGWATASLRW